MRFEPDVSKATCYGSLTGDGRRALRVSSICFDCGRPVGQCRWLLDKQMYEGTVYWEQIVEYDSYRETSYVIIHCPRKVKK